MIPPLRALAATHDARSAGPLEDAPVLHVLFRVDGVDYALPAATVVQLESFLGASPVPGAPPYVAGILQLRARVVPVIDLRARFGRPAAAPTLDTRVVVGQHGDRIVALVADSAREVARIAPSQIQPPPRLIDEANHGFVQKVAHLGPRMILVLNFAQVIGEEPLDG